MDENEQIPAEETPSPEEGAEEPRTYSQEEYDALKDESIKNRKKAKQVDTLRDALRAATLEKACAGILHDPIAWSDSFEDENGLPDAEKIREAAEALADEKPHLARVRGDAGQGFRGDQSDAVDLAGMLRAGA